MLQYFIIQVENFYLVFSTYHVLLILSHWEHVYSKTCDAFNAISVKGLRCGLLPEVYSTIIREEFPRRCTAYRRLLHGGSCNEIYDNLICGMMMMH
jgi:hypothetical protein